MSTYKILFVTLGACIVAFLVFLYGPKTAEATYQEHKVTICHNGQTIEVSAIADLHHLRQHEEDYRGECKQEEPKDYCEYLEGVQGEDEDCPKPEPTCEELQNCEPEEPPVVEEPKKDTPDAPKVRYSQGPHGVKGDGKCQIELHKINGSTKVEIRWATDGVFGNGYQSDVQKDDGTLELNIGGDRALLKVRGRDSKGEWSSAKWVKC